MTKVFLVAGLGFGDEGKGTITESLCFAHRANLVVRYNGGAQAGHNVVTPDGKHHMFSQFGAGTLLGAKTHLSRFMVLHPGAMLAEAEHLRHLGVSQPFAGLSIDQSALVITPYQQAANQLRELSRGDGRHGSCGLGVGETRQDYLEHGLALYAGDCLDPVRLNAKLTALRDHKVAQLKAVQVVPSPASSRAFAELTRPVAEVADLFASWAHLCRMVGSEYLAQLLAHTPAAVFEGAQGVLLDETYGFQPYTTWTDTTFANATQLLTEVRGLDAIELIKIGVMRSYMTRHGRGPLPTQSDWHLHGEHNQTGLWQENFRVGHLDLVLLRYALAVLGGVDQLAVTHIDQRSSLMANTYGFTEPHRGVGYVSAEGDLIYSEEPSYQRQVALTQALTYVRPYYRNLPTGHVNHPFQGLEPFLGAPIGIYSGGPTRSHKRFIRTGRI